MRAADAFTDERRRADFAYYEGLTVRDSSAVGVHPGVVAADGGSPRARYDYFGEAALMEPPRPGAQHRRRRPHRVSGGAWIAAVAGFGGMRDHDGELTFAPRLPPRLERLAFRLTFRGSLLKVEVRAGERHTRYSKARRSSWPTTARRVTVGPGVPVTLDLPAVPQRPTPTQPPGRAPSPPRKDERKVPEQSVRHSRRAES
jgi:alpha,alpha-trehalose phosphorylase